MIRILHQRNKCIGCNACVEINKSRWRISKKDGKCTLVGGVDRKGIYSVNVFEDELREAVLAARNCPVKIIRIEKVL